MFQTTNQPREMKNKRIVHSIKLGAKRDQRPFFPMGFPPNLHRTWRLQTWRSLMAATPQTERGNS